jgi:hypothetical protein
MMRRYAVLIAMALTVSPIFVSADVGEPAQDQITRVQQARPFLNAPVDHGPIAGRNLERWKFESAGAEDYIFTIDAKNLRAPIVRETYVRITAVDPFSLRPRQATNTSEFAEVLSPRENSDFIHAAGLAPIIEAPLHIIAYFYRGKYAAYEVLEPQARRYGVRARFEWRGFPLAELNAAMKAARSCDNGPDCAAWY